MEQGSEGPKKSKKLTVERIEADVNRRIEEGDISCDEFVRLIRNLNWLGGKIDGDPQRLDDLAVSFWKEHSKTCPTGEHRYIPEAAKQDKS